MNYNLASLRYKTTTNKYFITFFLLITALRRLPQATKRFQTIFVVEAFVVLRLKSQAPSKPPIVIQITAPHRAISHNNTVFKRLLRKQIILPSFKGYNRSWLRHDLAAALVVTAIAIPESLGFAIIVGLPVQAGLYCALLAPVVFAALTSSKRLVVGADSATAALVASGAATIAVAGTAAYSNAVVVLGLVTAAVLLAMSAAKFGAMADLISRPVLIGFISGVGVQLIIGKLPEMLGLKAHGNLFDKLAFIAAHLGQVSGPTIILSVAVVAVIVAGWKFRWPGALIALGLATIATKVFGLPHLGIEVVGIVPAGLPALKIPQITPHMIIELLPAAASIAVVILAQSLAVIRNSAARHEEPVDDNRDLAALGLANATSALIGGFAINGSPPRTSAAEMAGGHSQLVNIIMAGLVGVVLVAATGLFAFVPAACLAAVVFTIGLHLVKVRELREILAMRRSEFGVALAALAGVAIMGVQRGVMLAVITSLIERLRREYHPHDEVLLQDRQYTQWAADRFAAGKHELDAPAGLLIYRFNDALFFENSGYFLSRVNQAIAASKEPITCLVLDASAISDVDYTAAQVLLRLIGQLDADDIRLALAHVSPRLRYVLARYGLANVIGNSNIYPSLRFAIEAHADRGANSRDRIRALGLPAASYVVIGGAALELMGIRETNDVDLVVNKAAYRLLRDKHWKEFVHDDGKVMLSHHGYRIMLHWMGRDLSNLQKSAVLVDGIPVMSLDDLVDCKIALGRKKDLEDVVRIKAWGVLPKPKPAAARPAILAA